MKALVAGGTGFIGSHIVKDLVSRGFQVKVLVRSNSSLNNVERDGVEFVKGDISDIASLRECLKDVELVCSSFGILGQWGTPEQKYREINTEGVKNLILGCQGHNIRQFIHISSAGVLGPLPDGMVADESFPLNPSNMYERSKADAEQEVVSLCNKMDMPFVIIRPEFVYGPGDMHVLGLFKAIKERKFVLLGKGNTLLHPTYIDDLIQGIGLCNGNERAAGKTFLITGERPVSVKELAEVIAEELGVRLSRVGIPLFLAKAGASIMEIGAGIFHYEPVLTHSRVKFFTENRAFSWQKAKRELGYIPEVDFKEGVRRTIHWYREKEYL